MKNICYILILLNVIQLFLAITIVCIDPSKLGTQSISGGIDILTIIALGFILKLENGKK